MLEKAPVEYFFVEIYRNSLRRSVLRVHSLRGKRITSLLIFFLFEFYTTMFSFSTGKMGKLSALS